MNIRKTTTVVVGALFGLLSGCGQTGNKACNATCQGCCDSAGICQQGILAAACGLGGASCLQCTASQVCRAGGCIEPTVDSGAPDAGALDSGVLSDAGADAGVDAGIPSSDGGTCRPGMFCGRVLYTGSRAGRLNFVLHNSDPVTGPPSKTAAMDAGTFPMSFEFAATSLFTGSALAPGPYYFITWLDVTPGDSSGGPNYTVDPVYPPRTTPATPQPRQVLPASGGASPIDITLQDP